jgi:hypothetical protein
MNRPFPSLVPNKRLLRDDDDGHAWLGDHGLMLGHLDSDIIIIFGTGYITLLTALLISTITSWLMDFL